MDIDKMVKWLPISISNVVYYTNFKIIQKDKVK